MLGTEEVMEKTLALAKQQLQNYKTERKTAMAICATAYETDVKVLRNRINVLRVENESLRDEVEKMRTALQVIHTWATVEQVLVKRHVVALCERTLMTPNVPHEGRQAASSPGVPLDVVVGARTQTEER